MANKTKNLIMKEQEKQDLEAHGIRIKLKEAGGDYVGGYLVDKKYRLGEIRWYGAFRQYVFCPDNDTIWSKTCNELINNFLDKVNKRHRNKLKKRAGEN